MFKFWIVIILSVSACTNKQKLKEQRALAHLHLKIGTGYLTQGNLPLAIKELRIAQDLDPTNPSIMNNLGLAYYLRKELTLAKNQFEGALRQRPTFTEVRNNLARVHIDQKTYPAAIKELKIATQDLVYTKPEKTWNNLGYAYLKTKAFEPAREALRKAIDLNRKYCPAYTMYGKAYYEEKKFGKAADSLDQAVRKRQSSRFDEPVYYSALSHMKIGQMDEARAKLNEVIASYPDSPFAQKARSILKMIQ